MSNLRFDPPGPGSWMLDTAHCAKPRSQYMHALFAHEYSEGFREGFKQYGALLDTLEYGTVGAFPYTAVRPLGAPRGARGTPPKWLFKLMLAVHPAIRSRVRRARLVLEQRLWREDIRKFWDELPAEEARTAALAAEPVADLDAAAFVDHVERAGAFIRRRMFEHFRNIPAHVLPVGDFLAHVADWTGTATGDALVALRGHSPASVAATRALDAAAGAIAADPIARAMVCSGDAGATTLAALRDLDGPAGEAVERLLARYGDAILSGHDVAELRVIEMPDVLVATLRPRATKPSGGPGDGDARAAGDRVAAALRARVPEKNRAAFDDLLAEARAAYPLRDARVSVDIWALGVVRRTLLEAGRRLACTKKIAQQDDVFDLTQEEILSLLAGGGSTPSPTDVAARAHRRRTARIEDAPLRLGPEPAGPPPLSWLPPEAARLTRAFGTYRALMEEDRSSKDLTVVRGVGASPGRRTGRARLVRSAADFVKLQPGDILVAPITTPTYNAILPLLGGVVTDRGGLLSHPAIVSREYGFPGVVGAGDATARIPDGALVEIDGAAGTVTVLTP